MHRHPWFCELTLTVALFSSAPIHAQEFDSQNVVIAQSDQHAPINADVCSKLPTIVNGGSSQLEIDEYFDKPEAQWTDQDLNRLSSDYSTCYDSSTINFGQKSITRSEFSSIVQNIVASANNYRQAARVFEVEKSTFSPECQAEIADFISDGSSSLENNVPFQRISQLFKDGHHDEACDIDKEFSTKLQVKRTIVMQCFEHARSIKAPTFKPEWFSATIGADEKLKSIIDADMSLNRCPR